MYSIPIVNLKDIRQLVVSKYEKKVKNKQG